MIGLLVMETILQLGVIKIKNMSKFLQKQTLIKKIKLLLKQKLKQNHQLLHNPKKNKIKKI
jgi:molybdenum cofactor biosynthesis enzyme